MFKMYFGILLTYMKKFLLHNRNATYSIPIYFIQKESRDNIISIVTNSSKSPEKALNRLSEAFQTLVLKNFLTKFL